MFFNLCRKDNFNGLSDYDTYSEKRWYRIAIFYYFSTFLIRIF
jgi:hypothetical protein